MTTDETPREVEITDREDRPLSPEEVFASMDLSPVEGPTGGTPYKFDETARRAYLVELSMTGRLLDSARAAGVHPITPRYYRAGGELEDPRFEAAVQVALELYRESIRREVRRRAVDGWRERGIYDKDGNELGEVRKYSDRLLELEAKRLDETYREKVSVDQRTELRGSMGVHPALPDLRRLSPAARAALRVVLEELRGERGAGDQGSAPALPPGAPPEKST